MSTTEESTIRLGGGWELRSGSSGDRMYGEYVRVVDPEGEEELYWHFDEWVEEPVLVMGAIMSAAAHQQTVYESLQVFLPGAEAMQSHLDALQAYLKQRDLDHADLEDIQVRAEALARWAKKERNR